MNPDEALARVLSRTGVGFPRGVLGDETRALAAALAGGAGGDVAELADAAAAVHWPRLQGPMMAAVQRGGQEVEGPDREAFAVVQEWAADPDPDNPFARALAVRAAVEWAAAVGRARQHLRDAEDDLGDDTVRAAARATTAAGAMAVELLDLDPEDFMPEIVAYIEAERSEDAVEELARITGDVEIRAWARESVREVDDAEAPLAVAAVRQIAAGAPPEDPAADLVWVPTILALAEAAVERALVEEAAAGGGDTG